ncbi:TonB-dependent receptor [Oxalobacter sp. OxGP1]|uniref:TonB-dependent receptor plug domain-containing protein n=1 Tax=Oxalobacter paeniformigenes TaxID=2946594 RepID=UPI0022B03495|nr:TonB-dependent receptor [Oxalobacter paeniformigenes]MCZ4052345.1 TonB-dependent receptor [Oxalobacter paeniformigenes]
MYPHVSDRRRRRMAIRPLLLVSALACCFAGSAYAQEIVESEEKTLEPVVVTASRVEQLQKDAIPSTTVISSETIQNKKLADLPSLLRSEAGIEFARTGGAGQPVSLFMRGTESRHVLVLLDGIPIRDTTDAGTAGILSHIQPDQIDHIEVVRGNVSAIYGSGAIGGVIQIFTKQGTGKPTANVFAEYGSHDTTKIGAGISGKTEGGTSFALSATRYRTDGFSAMNASKDSTVNSDDDYDRNVSVNAAVSQRLNKDHEIGARLYMYDAKFDYDAQNGPNEEASGKAKALTTALYSKNRFTQDWLSTLTFSYTNVERHYDVIDNDKLWGYDMGYRNKYESDSKLLQWENRIALSSDWTLTAGVDVGSDEARIGYGGSSSFNVDRDRYSAYAGVLGNIGAHSLQANVRYDHVEDTDSDTTGFLGYGYNLTPSWKLLASVSTSFLAPTLDQLYNPQWGSNNENLESEHSTNYEAGIQYAQGKDLVRLTVFEWHTRNLISSVNNRYTNIGRAKSTGVELNMMTDILGMDVAANLTWQNPKDREEDKQLPKRSRWFGSLNVSKTIGSWYFGGDVQYNTHRYDYAGRYELSSYWLVNLDARYNINKNVSLYARIENLFDREYETTWGYNEMDRAAYVGVNVKM